MSFRRTALSSVGGFDPTFKFHQDETDACLAVLGAGYKILYDEGRWSGTRGARAPTVRTRGEVVPAPEVPVGRNNSYLVRKHFGKQVRFADYFGSRFMGFFTGGPARGRGQKEAASDTGDMPRFFVAVGASVRGLRPAQSWKDGGSAAAREGDARPDDVVSSTSGQVRCWRSTPRPRCRGERPCRPEASRLVILIPLPSECQAVPPGSTAVMVMALLPRLVKVYAPWSS